MQFLVIARKVRTQKYCRVAKFSNPTNKKVCKVEIDTETRDQPELKLPLDVDLNLSHIYLRLYHNTLILQSPESPPFSLVSTHLM